MVENKPKNELLKYIEKIRNVIDYLAKRNELYSKKNKIIFLNTDAALKDNKISIEEEDFYDYLSSVRYNELNSIARIIEFINDGEYEVQEQEIKDVISQPMRPNEFFAKEIEAHKAVMKRTKELLQDITMKLSLGLKIIPSSENEKLALFLYEEVVKKQSNCPTMFYVTPEAIKENLKDMYIFYDVQQKCFRIVQGDKEYERKLDVPSAMKITIEYLADMDYKKKVQERNTGIKVKEDFTYRGMHININVPTDNEDHEGR